MTKILSITMIDSEEAVFTPDNYYEEEDEVVELPNPEAKLTVSSINSMDSIPAENRYIMDETGDMFVVSSSMDLLSLSIYTVAKESILDYSKDNLVTHISDLGANTNVAIQLNVSRDQFPNQLLVAEEHNGALGYYLISFSEVQNQVYLVPIL